MHVTRVVHHRPVVKRLRNQICIPQRVCPQPLLSLLPIHTMYAEHDSQLFEWHPETTQYNGYAGNEQQPGGSRGNGLVDDGATYSPAISNAATDGSIYIPSIEDIQLFLEGTLTLEDLATPGPSVIGVDDLQPAFDSPIQLPPLQLHAMHDGFAPQLPSIRRYKAFGSGDADRRESRRRSAPSFDSERPSRPTWHTQPQRATTPTRFDPTAHASGSALPADLAGAAGAYAEGSSTGNGAYFSDAGTNVLSLPATSSTHDRLQIQATANGLVPSWTHLLPSLQVRIVAGVVVLG